MIARKAMLYLVYATIAIAITINAVMYFDSESFRDPMLVNANQAAENSIKNITLLNGAVIIFLGLLMMLVIRPRAAQQIDSAGTPLRGAPDL